jgi:hypothetical protein
VTLSLSIIMCVLCRSMVLLQVGPYLTLPSRCYVLGALYRFSLTAELQNGGGLAGSVRLFSQINCFEGLRTWGMLLNIETPCAWWALKDTCNEGQ